MANQGFPPTCGIDGEAVVAAMTAFPISTRCVAQS
jgi:hypothetical protein